MEKISVERISTAQLESLQAIARITFDETFSAFNTEQNMTKYLEERFSTVQLTSELADPDCHFFLALLGDKTIGYLKLNAGRAQTELKDNKAVEIERIYVLKEFQGKHIGQLLFRKAIDVAVELQAEYIWLGVWENNHRALAFYRKNGFTEFDRHIFRLGNEEQTDLMMKLELKKIEQS